VGDWILGPDRTPHKRSITLPAEVLALSRALTVGFEVPTLRTPASLGWSSDSRTLGLRLSMACFGSGELTVPKFHGLGGGAGGAHFTTAAIRGLSVETEATV
jgi:hypothetical protein